MLSRIALLTMLSLLPFAFSTQLEWKGIPSSKSSASSNTLTLNTALSTLPPNTSLLIPNQTFYLSGGVYASNLINATIILDGTLKFDDNGRKNWPTESCTKGTCVKKAILIEGARGLTLTSTNVNGGLVDGSGEKWWGYVEYLIYGEDRPKLITLYNVTDVLVEDWHFRQSAYHTFHADDIANLEIRRCTIDNRFNDKDSHGPLNLQALNTDGFDVSGKNIYIHDCKVWNQDDCFTIVPTTGDGINADCTENVLIENVEASGLGLTVGSIKPTTNHACIKNITFRNAYMHHTFKGIYIKSASNPDPNASAEITDILYENITMDQPEQVPIWIGPAQEGDSENACSLAWPYVDRAECPAPNDTMKWTNVVLRNVVIKGAKVSPGIIFGNEDNPMEGVVFDGVVFDNFEDLEDAKPWGEDFYYCKGVQGVAMGGTTPVPPCFEKE